MVDKCTLFTSHTHICIYSYKIQNTVDCHPDNDWATIPCLLLAPWLTSWLSVFCSLTNMMQDPFAAVGMCQIWKILVRFPCKSLSSHRVTKRSNSAFWHLANIPSSFRAVVGISLAGSCSLWFLFLGGSKLLFSEFSHTKLIQHAGIFPLLKISMVQLISRNYLFTLYMEPYQGTNKDAKGSFIRLRTSTVHWGSWIECKN